MQRVLVFGRGGSGKSTFARRLSEMSGLPLIELDHEFWQPELTPMSAEAWLARQKQLVAADSWIMDGDLGPYDVLTLRLRRADTIFLLDLPVWLCVWRSLLRGRERADYWKWVFGYRRRHLPQIRQQIAGAAPDIDLHILRRPKEVQGVLDYMADE